MHKCPYCFEEIEKDANRCPYCTQFLIDRPVESDYKSIDKKICVFCGKKIIKESRICKYCRKWLDQLQQDLDDLEGM
ncbi:MAG: zinc ribbon domain-containing protein [Candidatus Omnitrophota bacterium]